MDLKNFELHGNSRKMNGGRLNKVTFSTEYYEPLK